MNAVSTTVQRYDYTRMARRADGVAAAGQLRANSRFRDHLPESSNQDNALQGEIVDSESSGTYLRVRGVTLEGSSYSAHDAIVAYQTHRNISPSTVSTPGKLLDALA